MKPSKIVLSSEHIEAIKQILNDHCREDTCISRKKVFETLQKEKPLKMEPYRFCQLLTNAILSGRILGFETKAGRGGGIRKSIRPRSVRENVRMGLQKLSNFSADDERVVDFVTRLVER